MAPDAPPPHRLIASTPIDTATASTMLQTYLAHSDAHPHLHPDALITPTGVTFSSHGGPTGGVVMHNLRRIAAGLRGHYLDPEPTPEPDAADGLDWQDKQVYEHEQAELEIGDLGHRVHVVQDGGEEPELELTAEKRKGDMLTKEDRKKAKKERDAQRKKVLEKERQAKA